MPYTNIFRALAGLLLLAAALPARADRLATIKRELQENRGKLNAIQEELDKGRKTLQDLQAREKGLVRKLGAMEKQLELSETYLQRLDSTALAWQRAVDTTKVDLQRAEADLRDRKSVLVKRMRYMYKRGRLSWLDVVLEARSWSGLFHRYKYFKLITEEDRRVISGVKEERRRVEEQNLILNLRLDEVNRLQKRKETERNALVKAKTERQKLLGEVQGQRDTYVQMVADLERQQEELNGVIAALEQSRREAEGRRAPAGGSAAALTGEFAQLRGRLPWPVSGAVIKGYGKIIHPKYKTATINNGIDIRARLGDCVLAVAGGRVAYLARLRSFGNFVVLDHQEGFYTIYANLDQIDVQKDQEIRPGECIAKAGESGSTEGVKLHFEIRRSAGTVNPLDWLKKK